MKKNKILGCLYGAAYGDSLGAITEFCYWQDIKKSFPNGCHDYCESISGITKGIKPGMVTDDFGSSIYFMKTILKHDGQMNKDIAIEAILEWSKDPIVFDKYAGQNTKAAIERLKKGIVIDEIARQRHFSRLNTNGGAMKVSPVGLLACQDMDTAMQYAMDLCWPTHYNSAATSAASAIACAVCESQKENSTLETICEQAIEGAKLVRFQLEKEGFSSFGPYVDVKIKEAIEKGKKCNNIDETIRLLNSSIGTGIIVQESIPAVFAIIVASKGNLEQALQCSISAGGDTDTISSMIGAILGGYRGVEAIPKKVIHLIQKENEFLNIKDVIDRYTNLIISKGE